MDFRTVVDRTLSHEGGYTEGKGDPGGETKWGIAKRSYPNTDIKNLTREDAIKIYERDFWEPLGKYLSPAVQFQVFDASVNHGLGNALRFLQRAVGVADDGVWGPKSQAAYGAMEQNDVLLGYIAARLEFMTKLSTWETFGKGWARRMVGNLRHAMQDN